MKLNLAFKASVFTGLIFFLVGCVSVKKFDAQTQELNETRKQLNDAVIAQQQIKTAQQLTRDSLYSKIAGLDVGASIKEYNLYKTATQTGDYAFASDCLQRLLSLDSSNAYWVYDSLALYHYLYLLTPGQTKRSPAANYFTNKGLTLNPMNTFLLEIKGKLLIEEGKDTAAYALFSDIWKKTGDYTFYWDMTYIDLYLYGKVKEVEGRISEVLAKTDSNIKTVRVDQLEEKIIETIVAKAAFLYLRGIIQAEQGNRAKAIKTIEEVVKIAPNYMTAQRALYQMKNPQYR